MNAPLVERSTPLEKAVNKGRVVLPDCEEKADMYSATLDILRSHGLQRYEVSNFARGSENRGRHNSRYWQGGSFLGLGPGAHGRYYKGKKKIIFVTFLGRIWDIFCTFLGHFCTFFEHF